MFSATVAPLALPGRDAVFGNVRHARAAAFEHAEMGDVGRAKLDRAAGNRPKPADRIEQFALAIALDAGNSDDLAGPQDEIDVRDGVQAMVVRDGQVRDAAVDGYAECRARHG